MGDCEAEGKTPDIPRASDIPSMPTAPPHSTLEGLLQLLAHEVAPDPDAHQVCHPVSQLDRRHTGRHNLRRHAAFCRSFAADIEAR